MTHYDDTDAILAGWFSETAPAAVPLGLHDEVIARVRTSRQHLRWSAVLRTAVAEPASRPTVRLGFLAMAVAAILVATLVWAGLPAATPLIPTPTERPAPSSRTQGFMVPFSYTIPEGSELRQTRQGGPARGHFLGRRRGPSSGGRRHRWVRGRALRDRERAGRDGRCSRRALGHGSGRMPLRTAPAEFLADLDELSMAPVEPATATTLDGRPAFTTRTDPGRRGVHDLHVSGSTTGLPRTYVVWAMPYRLIAADVDGVTVVVQVGRGPTTSSPPGCRSHSNSSTRSTSNRPRSRPIRHRARTRSRPRPRSRSTCRPATRSRPDPGSRRSAASPRPSPSRSVRTGCPTMVTRIPLEGWRAPSVASTRTRATPTACWLAYAMTAWGHGNDGRVRLRSAPAELLEDMDDLLVGVHLEPATNSTLDGRPALTTRSVPGMTSNHSDLHLGAKMTGLSGDYIIMTAPYRLIVADIDGVTVLVQIWSQTEEDLAAWLPVAQQFVDSIQFSEH